MTLKATIEAIQRELDAKDWTLRAMKMGNLNEAMEEISRTEFHVRELLMKMHNEAQTDAAADDINELNTLYQILIHSHVYVEKLMNLAASRELLQRISNEAEPGQET
jgi:hypothetical protein